MQLRERLDPPPHLPVVLRLQQGGAAGPRVRGRPQEVLGVRIRSRYKLPASLPPGQGHVPAHDVSRRRKEDAEPRTADSLRGFEIRKKIILARVNK